MELAIKKQTGVDAGNTKVQKMIVFLQNNEFIKKHGKDRSPKAFYKMVEQPTYEKEETKPKNQIELELSTPTLLI